MKIVKDGYPFIIFSLILTFIVLYFWGIVWAVVPFVLMLYFAYFFRNPNRPLPNDENILYAPADGRVMSIEEIYDEEYLNDAAVKVTVFLSVFNVHF